MTTAYDQNKLRCEQEHGTEYLPADLRDLLYRNAYEEGHAYGLDEVVNYYADFAEVALLAYANGRYSVAADLRLWATGDGPNDADISPDDVDLIATLIESDAV